MHDVIYLDPPWKYPKRNSGKTFGEGASNYPTLTFKEMLALDIGALANPNCAIFMWHVCPKLVEYDANQLFKAWGFRYITVAFVWVKIDQSGYIRKLPGHYSASNIEPCLLGIRGKMPVVEKLVDQVIFAEIKKPHSAKPLEAYDRINRMYPTASKIELFARQKHKTFDFATGLDYDGMCITDYIDMRKEPTNGN